MTGGAVAAVDLGATSGRVMIGRIAEDTLELETEMRFPNGPVEQSGGLHWDFTRLYRSVLEGLREAMRREPGIASVGIDSCAVDYGLVSAGEVQGEPFHYRDEARARVWRRVHALAPFAELYRRNGLQFLHSNTLYQYVPMRISPTRMSHSSSRISSPSCSPARSSPNARTRPPPGCCEWTPGCADIDTTPAQVASGCETHPGIRVDTAIRLPAGRSFSAHYEGSRASVRGRLSI